VDVQKEEGRRARDDALHLGARDAAHVRRVEALSVELGVGDAPDCGDEVRRELRISRREGDLL
jgi:hypothetical protein